MVIPFGTIAGGQVYNANYPTYWNMAKIGFLIAHEMMHNFDSTGIRVGSNITDDSYQRLLEEMKSNIPKGKFQPKITDNVQAEINIPLVFNEVFADITGLQLAWSTYLEQNKTRSLDDNSFKVLPNFNKMNDGKLFFLASAQVFCTEDKLANSALSFSVREHLPSQVRVNYLMSHSKEFLEAYHCDAYSSSKSLSPEELEREIERSRERSRAISPLFWDEMY